MTEKMENLTRANVMSTSTEDNEGWIYQIIRGFRQKGHMDGLAGTKTCMRLVVMSLKKLKSDVSYQTNINCINEN